jgi:hypothetical protein
MGGSPVKHANPRRPSRGAPEKSNFGERNTLRGTGRTQRMLEVALADLRSRIPEAASSSQRLIVIVGADQRHALELERRFREMATEAEARHVAFLSVGNGIYDRVRGLRAGWHVDHYASETAVRSKNHRVFEDYANARDYLLVHATRK